MFTFYLDRLAEDTLIKKGHYCVSCAISSLQICIYFIIQVQESPHPWHQNPVEVGEQPSCPSQSGYPQGGRGEPLPWGGWLWLPRLSRWVITLITTLLINGHDITDTQVGFITVCQINYLALNLYYSLTFVLNYSM